VRLRRRKGRVIEIVAAEADGRVRLVDPDMGRRVEIEDVSVGAFCVIASLKVNELRSVVWPFRPVATTKSKFQAPRLAAALPTPWAGSTTCKPSGTMKCAVPSASTLDAAMSLPVR
jgi:hypothetical protein